MAGRIFTIDAAQWLRHCGLYGAGGEILDIVLRPLIPPILAATQPASAYLSVPKLFYFNPNDLHPIIFYIALIGLAHMQMIATQIYSEKAEIV